MLTFKTSLTIVVICLLAAVSFSQTTSFVYQGKLQDGGISANGTYQFQFKLYDTETGGNQIGLTIADITATATNGIFAVNLSFGGGAFNSQEFRFLEIGVRPNGSQAPYTVLNPRQQVTSTPYAIRALSAATADHAVEADNSANLGGIPAAQYVITTDPRMSDDRNPLPNSGHYIQNGTNQQASSNFDVSGEGKAFKLTGVFVNATSEFQQGGSRVMQFNAQKSGVIGLFTGPNSTGADNMFVGFESGNANTTGSVNAFVGSQSGKANTTGLNNSFFGAYSGFSNTTGTNNAFFGANTGLSNTGSFNAFFGSNSGFANTSGADNSFFGNLSGLNNSSGSNNSFFGRNAGKSVDTAANNSIFGAYAGENTTTGGNVYFGTFAGQKNTTGFQNVFVGFSSGKENIGGSSNTFVGANSGQNTGALGDNNVAIGANAKIGTTVSNAIAIGANAFASSSNSLVISNAINNVSIPNSATIGGNLTISGNAGAASVSTSGISVGLGGLTVSGTSTLGDVMVSGSLQAGGIGAGGGLFTGQLKADSVGVKQPFNGGSTNICYVSVSGYLQLAHCSSSRRYKDEIKDYSGGLDMLMRMRPVSFRWKSDDKRDVGFVAEEINEIEPLLNNFNSKGEIEGVKYGQITAVLVNAVKEQQKQIDEQRAQIEALKALVCSGNPSAALCGLKKQ